jgi:eukaryotic-like serine/threonine-protein kinase
MQQRTKTDVIMRLVERALARPQAERQPYLVHECGDDRELFSQARNYVQWEERMGDFLLDPFCQADQPDSPFEPGQLLIHRFRIIREIARGGMGIVWEAMDEKLERRVAIKCAREGFGKQLPPEVRNARDISHPNVCKIFEIHTASGAQGDIDFISMEFVEGKTLSERLHEGALPQKECVAIALQLCAGLSEAHRNNVIHGDLKTNNVILSYASDGSVRPVIMDFGLARRSGASGQIPIGDLVAGTPAYMAPELWKGARPSVATDIYALGVMLWELSSELSPTALAMTPSTLPVGEPADLKPPTGRGKWGRIAAGCLEADPARRFRNADEVARALRPPRIRRWLLAGAAAAVLAVVTAGVTYQGTTMPQESVRLAILPVQSNGASDPQSERLLRNIADRVQRLKSNKHTNLKVIPLNTVRRSHADSVEKSGDLLKATHVLHATVEKEKDQLAVHAFLTDTRSRVDLKQWNANYSPAEMGYVPALLTSMVTETFHLPVDTAGAINAAARNDYLAGLGYLRRDSSIPIALASFERAVLNDPASSLAYAGLAEAQWFEYFLTKQRAWLDRSAESARQAQRRNLDLAHVHRVAGLHLSNAGFYEQAAAAYRRATELDPADAENYRRLGQVYERSSQKVEALEAFLTAVSLQPDYYRAHLELGAYYFNRADYSRAATPLKKAADLAPNEPNVRVALGTTYMDLGMYVEAEQQLRHAVARDEAANSLHTLALILMYQARDREAIDYFARALRRNPESYLSWLCIAIAYRRTNRAADSEAANRRGQEAAEAAMPRNPRDGYPRAIRGYFAAVLGDGIRAESETAQALNLAPDDAETRWVTILTYEALARRESSLAVLAHSSRQQVMDVNRWPDLADLRHDSRFLQLLADFNLK